MSVATVEDRRTNIEILQDIESRHGGLTPEAIVEEASDPTHEWHCRFEWDDAIAAHKHRIDTARGIIRSVKFEIEYHNLILRPPQYVRDPAKDSSEQGYRSLVPFSRSKKQKADLMHQEIARGVGNLRRAFNVALALNEIEIAERISQALEVLGIE